MKVKLKKSKVNKKLKTGADTFERITERNIKRHVQQRRSCVKRNWLRHSYDYFLNSFIFCFCDIFVDYGDQYFNKI